MRLPTRCRTSRRWPGGFREGLSPGAPHGTTTWVPWQILVRRVRSDRSGTRLFLVARWQGAGPRAVLDASARWRPTPGAGSLEATVTTDGRVLAGRWRLPATAHPDPDQVVEACDTVLAWARRLVEGRGGVPAAGPA